MPEKNSTIEPGTIGPHGIDITAPGGIDSLLDFHRQTFGNAVMQENAGGDSGGDGGNDDGGDSGNDSGKGTGDNSGGEPGNDSGNDSGDKDGDKDGDKGASKPWEDPDEAKAEIEKLRRENSRKRAAPKDAARDAENALIQKMGKAMGIIKDDAGEATPEQLTQKLTEKDTEAKTAQLELAVYKNAGNADADALLDSRRFQDHIKAADLDPADTAAIKSEIKKFVDDNPKFKATRAAGQTSADRTGGSGEQRKQQPTTLNGAIGAHYGA